MTEEKKENTTDNQEDSEKKERDKIALLREILKEIEKQVKNALGLLAEESSLPKGVDHLHKAKMVGDVTVEGAARIIEGVFNGQNMIGPDGKEYSVPANYASKSKLVEGDILKLTIQADGRFVYKQIGPQPRRRLKGILTKDEATGEWRVLAEGKLYKVLLASVTYFRGEIGDEVVILVPEAVESSWAAVENILKKPVLIEEAKEI
jgi:hypothetical protein